MTETSLPLHINLPLDSFIALRMQAGTTSKLQFSSARFHCLEARGKFSSALASS